MAILDLSRAESPGEITAGICVIGSGSGGGTAARLLAEAGHDVVVVEEGANVLPKDLARRDAAAYDQLYMERGGRATDDLSVAVLQGRVLGGGPIINACDVVPIPEGVLRHWQKRFGLSGFDAAAIRPHLEATRVDLSAHRIPEVRVNRANALLRQGAEALGMRGEVMDHNRVGCVKLGQCFLGCAADAKRTPRNVAIPKALAAGARVLVRARAVRIEDAGAELKRVRVRALDPLGYHERGELTVRARAVVVAANAIASAQLLLRSGVGNEHVGRHLMLQPQLPIVAHFDELVDGQVGIPQAYAVTELEHEDHPEHGLWGSRIEGVMGTPGMVATMLPFAGPRGKEMMAQYSHMAASLLLAPDRPSGTVELKPDGRPLIRYEQRDDHKARLREAIHAAARIYLEAGARAVWVPTSRPLEIRSRKDLAAVADLSFRPATAPLVSAHQQGTVRFAPGPADGAADPDGQVYGTRDVYVFDSSGFPSSASSHTMTPIMTISRFLTSKLLSRLSPS